jgi:restriction endonuclease S subunit
MKYKAYEKYKPSGVDWLEDVPEHWVVKRLKYAALVQPSNVDKKTEEGEIPVHLCNYTDVYNNETIHASLKFMEASATYEEIRKFRVSIGDVIVTKDSESPNDIAIPAFVSETTGDLVCGYHLTQIKPKEIDGRYLFRLFQSKRFNDQFTVAANGITRFGLPQYSIANACVILPTIKEQQSIAAFLDFKTSQIDALIVKKRELLNKLAEKRQALITHAVTKGLNPKAKMKDSGVEWLGDVPEHWEVKRWKFLLQSPLKYGANESAELTDRELPRYIRITDIGDDGTLLDETFKSIPLEIAKNYLLKDGDILLARSGATVGKSFLYRKEMGKAAYAGYLIRARCSDELLPDFANYFLQSTSYWQWLKSVFIQATIQNVSAEKYANFCFCDPSLDVQKEIIAFLDLKTREIDFQTSKIQLAIEKLQEFRSALITNAVTGKIDVRNE